MGGNISFKGEKEGSQDIDEGATIGLWKGLIAAKEGLIVAN